MVVRGHVPLCRKCGARRHYKRNCPRLTAAESGADEKEQLVKAAPVEKPVMETPSEERNIRDDEEARAKAPSRDSTSSEEATDIAPKAKRMRRKKDTRKKRAEKRTTEETTEEKNYKKGGTKRCGLPKRSVLKDSHGGREILARPEVKYLE